MGWDLYSRKNNCYFRVTMYGWPRLRMALRFLGADVSRMSVYNDGSYVPARVAVSWASAIENGIDSLSLAIVKDRSVQEDEGYFIIPTEYDKKRALEFICDYYGGSGKMKQAQVKLDRIGPMSAEMRRFLLDFGKFCRKSKGFEQW